MNKVIQNENLDTIDRRRKESLHELKNQRTHTHTHTHTQIEERERERREHTNT